MADMLRLIARMFTITLGFFAASLAAGSAFVFLARLVLPSDFGRIDELELTVTLAVGILGVSSLFARAMLLPAFAVIAGFEFLKLRDWLSHALAGGLLALAAASLPLAGTADAANPGNPAWDIAIRIACGIIGATFYWVVAGRHAGRWLPSERAKAKETGDIEA